MSKKKIRLLVADDHAILRAGLRMLINDQPDMRVVGEAADGEEAVRCALTTRPDVALVDLSMPRLGGVETLQRLRRELPSARLLVLTMHNDPAYAKVTQAAGASGHVIKDSDSSEVLSAIRAVHHGRSFVQVGTSAQGGPTGPAPSPLPVLSPRELQVLRLLARGHTNREVATLLTLSVKTVETHRSRLLEKLGARTRAELVQIASQLGLR
ncbi:MAG TPA: response regulator transcription factor [Methylomirabilota bacterium]|jgi:two-component system, NarL family, response regulator NreC|nr:response regulator transcription factor [Methylomirabilota bacterium]